METISKLTHRRFIIGQQGLWPGRRFKGLRGTASAIRTMGALQLDPLNIVARSQHIALQGRVLGYEQEFLDKVVYGQRQFFDYGGALFLYPMEELPYWRALMGRTAAYPRMVQFRAAHPAAMDEVLAALHSNGPMGNRDFGGDKLQYWSYRGRKDSAVALYYLWLLGEVMITERWGFDRVYDLRERVAPPAYQHSATMAEAEHFFALKTISVSNMIREKRFRALWQGSIERKVPQAEADRKLAEMLEAKAIARLQIEGSKESWIMLAGSVPVIEALEAGRTPREWRSSGPTTEEEVTLLAPLEMVSARGRARQLFDFDYVWEVYKPVHQRRWGYYTLPILYGDDLVARLDPKLDRRTGRLHILGFWLEDDTPKDETFASALGRGLGRFAKMAGAEKVDLSVIQPKKLRDQIKNIMSLA